MSDSPGGTATSPGIFSELSLKLPKFSRRSRSPQVLVQSVMGAQQSTASLTSHSLQTEPLVPPSTAPSKKPRTEVGLCVSIFHTSPSTGIPVADWVYYSGIPIALIHLIIVAIPGILQWAVFIAMVPASLAEMERIIGDKIPWISKPWHALIRKESC